MNLTNSLATVSERAHALCGDAQPKLLFAWCIDATSAGVAMAPAQSLIHNDYNLLTKECLDTLGMLIGYEDDTLYCPLPPSVCLVSPLAVTHTHTHKRTPPCIPT